MMASREKRQRCKDLYICTKPLQVMISLILTDQASKGLEVEFAVIDSFAGAKEFCERLKKFKPEIKATLFPNKKKAFSSIRGEVYRNIYLDSDVGVVNFIDIFWLKLFDFQVKFFVYEEGVGTYRGELTESLLKVRFLKKIGIGYSFGTCFFTSGIFVFLPSEYKAKNKKSAKVIPIEMTLSDWIGRRLDEVCELFGMDVDFDKNLNNICSGGDFYLYLSDWNVDLDLIDRLSDLGNFFVKLHPHIKNAPNIKQGASAHFISNGVPAELILIKMSLLAKKLTVYHSGTSALKYVSGKNIEEIRLDA